MVEYKDRKEAGTVDKTELDKKIEDARASGLEVAVIDADQRANLAKLVKEEIAKGNLNFDELWHHLYSKDKVDPSKYFISCGPGEIEDRYYACVMRPAKDEEIEAGHPEFIVVAVERGGGHETDLGAKTAGSLRYPTLPVLIGDNYFYPSFDSYSKAMNDELANYDERKERILQKAQERRERRGLVRRPNPTKRHYIPKNLTKDIRGTAVRCKECPGYEQDHHLYCPKYVAPPPPPDVKDHKDGF